jgi:hypothetical protein
MAIPSAAGSYNGWSWGLGTAFRVDEAHGFEDLPSLRRRTSPRSQQDGQWFGKTLLNEMVFQLALHVQPTATQSLDDILDSFVMATARVSDSALPLLWKNGTRMAIVRVANRNVVREKGVDYARATVQWEAIFPTVFEEPQRQVVLLPVPAAGGGVGISLRVPVRVTASSGVAQNLINYGNEESFPVVLIQGQAANPRLVNLTSGKSVAFGFTLNTGDQLLIDFRTKTSILNGATARVETTDSEWWTIAPAGTTGPSSTAVAFYADSADATASATIQWRSSWA